MCTSLSQKQFMILLTMIAKKDSRPWAHQVDYGFPVFFRLNINCHSHNFDHWPLIVLPSPQVYKTLLS